MDIEQEAKDLCEVCQNGASVSDVMEIIGRIIEQANRKLALMLKTADSLKARMKTRYQGSDKDRDIAYGMEIVLDALEQIGETNGI